MKYVIRRHIVCMTADFLFSTVSCRLLFLPTTGLNRQVQTKPFQTKGTSRIHRLVVAIDPKIVGFIEPEIDIRKLLLLLFAVNRGKVAVV